MWCASTIDKLHVGTGVLQVGKEVFLREYFNFNSMQHVRPHRQSISIFKSPAMASDEIVWYGSMHCRLKTDLY